MTSLLFVIAILATYRLARLFSKDMFFEWFRRWLGQNAASQKVVPVFFAELFHCPYCLGIWIAAVFAFYFTNSFPEWLLYTLAIAGGQSLIQEMIDHA